MQKQNSGAPHGEEYESFGDRLVELRNRHGITQSVLAEVLKLPQSTLANYETGTRKVPLSVIKKIVLYFNVSADYLIGIDDNEHPGATVTVAAHHDGDDWTDEELEYIELTKKMLRQKRK